MSKRKEFARIAQGGASNERRVASALVEAIDECRAEGVSPRDDSACFLILHQLAWLMTGNDISIGDDRLSARWKQAMAEVES